MFRAVAYLVAGALSLPSLADDSKELSFATQEFSPFCYEVGDVAHGPAVEIVKSACELANIKCSVIVLPWPRAQKYVNQGVINGVFPIGWSETRESQLYFSEPIIHTEYGFFARDNNNFNDVDILDLTGLTIAVYGPSNTSRTLIELTRNVYGVKLDITPHDEFPFKKLSVGRVDAVYSNRLVGKALIAKLGLTNINYYRKHLNVKYYIGLSKDNTMPNVAADYMDTISYMLNEGIIDNILSNYSVFYRQTDNN
ncbi:substrate-binding periplasmic protein [Psychromonas aquimarina]|uniref:substrate-binding periplasmic protein n=1 Tax=Psychromonas aquimarina TaxID=444919 RepID=UPI00041D3CD9|nr:transporter substrate-binding domain-containing protein [Psychromonas aquimarina]